MESILKMRFLFCWVVLAFIFTIIPKIAFAAATPQLNTPPYLNYTAPVAGQTANTTKITFLSPVGVSGAVKWQVKVQAGAFTPPDLDRPVAGAKDYVVNADILVDVSAGQNHLLLLATDDRGYVKAYADIDITVKISLPATLLTEGVGGNYTAPVPGSAIGTTKIATLSLGATGAAKWQYKVLPDTFIPASGSTLAGAIDYSAGNDIPITANQHLILLATDDTGHIIAYAGITVAAGQIEPAAAALVSETNYSTPVPGLTPGTTRIVTLDLGGIAGATKWQYQVQAGAFVTPPLNSTLSGASDYTVNTDIALTAGQHLMLLATDAGGSILAYADLTINSGQINGNNMLLSTPTNYSTPVPGSSAGTSKIATLDNSGILGATKWQHKVQDAPFSVPAYDSILGGTDYNAGADIVVTAGQHLILAAIDDDGKIKAYADIIIAASYIRPAVLVEGVGAGTNYSTPVPGGAGGNTKITTLDLTGITGAAKWQYAVQTGPFSVPGMDTTLTGATDYTMGADIPITAGQHLMLLATDKDGKIKAFADMIVTAGQININTAAPVLATPANYSVPEAGITSGTTKIVSLNLTGIAGATKWRVAIQAGPFTTPDLNSDSTLIVGVTDYTAGTDIPVATGQHLILMATDAGNLVKAYADITIAQNQIKSAASLTTNFNTEAEVVAGNRTIAIDLTLSGSVWASDLVTSQSKKNFLFDNMTASGSESAEWAKVIGNLKTATNPVNLMGNVLTITLPPTANYNITSDQTITVKIPSSLLQVSPAVALSPLTFTIKTDSSVTITGTITSSATAADVRKGGKTIIVTLKNVPNNAGGYDTWNANIASDTNTRQALFNALTPTAATAEVGNWSAVIDALKASATITRTSDTVVTIILPPVPTYNITTSQTIQLGSIPATCLTNPYQGNAFTPSSAPEFTITPAGATAAITGTVMGSSASPMSEANIVAGGNTIVYTLTSDTWVYDIATNLSKYNALFESLALTSPTTDENGMWTAVISAMNAGSIARTSDTVVTVTLPAVPAYHITAAQTITPSIPSNLVNSGVSPAVASTFTISPVTAAVSGTIVSTATTQDNIVSGGKTIILTLSNSTWATDVVTNSTKVTQLINGITASPDDATWQKVRTALKANTSKIKVAGAVLTITLPAVTEYYIAADQTITVSIDKSLLKQPTASSVIAKPSLTVFTAAPPPATATVSFSPALISVTEMRGGTATLDITLNNDTWVADIATNKNRLNTLIDGFTAATDANKWGLVKTAVKSPLTSITSVLTQGANNRITIKLPAVNSYNVSQDQVITIKIPRTLLNLTKSDLTATPPLAIKALEKGNLNSMLLDGSLDTLLANYSPSDIYVVVPKKYITKIDMANNTLGSTSYTNLNVQAENEVNGVQATSGGVVRTSNTYTVSKGKRIFSLVFSGLSTDTDVTVAAFSDIVCTNKLEKEVTIKFASGNTTPFPPKGTSTKSIAGAYSLQKLISDSKLFNSILLQYSLDELKVTAPN